MRKVVAAFSLLSLLSINWVEAECNNDAQVSISNYVLNPKSTARKSTSIKLDLPKIVATSKPAIVATIKRREAANPTISKAATTNFSWDGKDESGKLAPDGTYVVTFASPSGQIIASDTIVIDSKGVFDKLFQTKPAVHRTAVVRTSNANSGYNYFFGCTHAHTIYSDGGVPCATCTGSVQKPHDGATPTDAYQYGRNKGKLDFLAITEHNHLIDNVYKNSTKETALQRYHDAVAEADSATEAGKFVALYGMEWGTIDDLTGHLNIYNAPKLISWVDGKNPADKYITKNDYLTLYKELAKAEHRDSLGTFATFNHPGPQNFSNWAHNDEADKVMRGLAVVSGSSESNKENFEKNKGHDYSEIYDKALLAGWKVAPEAHQDNHCWNYGTASTNRTVVLIPKDKPLSKQSLMEAIDKRHFYATQDLDLKLAFQTKDKSAIMGDTISSNAPIDFVVSVDGADDEAVRAIELYGGKIGSNKIKLIASSIGSNELKWKEPAHTSEKWFYYARIFQIRGAKSWSAPIWVTWNQ